MLTVEKNMLATRDVLTKLACDSFLLCICMQRNARYSHDKAVLSGRLSVKRVDCDWTKENHAHILIPYERSFILVFWQEDWLRVLGGKPF